MVGSTVDNYRIVGLLGEGGMGQVFEAVEQPSGRRVAIKTLRHELASDGEMLARFRSEARALGMVKHPGLVEIYGTGNLPSGEAYIALEFLAGKSLRSWLLASPLSISESLRIARAVADVLAAVHAQKIVHRDLKPENVMLIPEAGVEGAPPRVKVLDFGIAKLSAQTTGMQTQIRTRTGVMWGTPSYMSPEQCGGDGEICDRTDVYALGIMLYELIAGQPPFLGEADSQIMGKQLFQEAAPLRQVAPEVTPDLELVVHTMLTKKPTERPSMETVAHALELIGTGKRLSDSQTRALRLARESMTVRRPRDASTAQLSSEIHKTARTSRGPLWLAGGALAVAGVLGFLLIRREVAPPPVTPPPAVTTPVPFAPRVDSTPPSPAPAPLPQAAPAEVKAKPSLRKKNSEPKRTGAAVAVAKAGAATAAASTGKEVKPVESPGPAQPPQPPATKRPKVKYFDDASN